MTSYEELIATKGHPMTRDQIDGIIRDLPAPNSCSAMAAQYQDKHIKSRLRNLLEEVIIIDEIYEDFKKDIIHGYYASRVSPGDSVGNTAAGGIAAPATQMNLSAYHATGLGGGGDALKSIIELFSRRKDRDPENMIMHFKNWNLADFEVQQELYKMEGITVDSLLDPIAPTEIFSDVSRKELYNVVPWLHLWEQTVKPEPNLNTSLFFRLKFNIYRLYTYRIPLIDIAEFIEGLGAVTCIPSATSLGYIDLFVDGEAVMSATNGVFTGNKSTMKDVISHYYRIKISKLLKDVTLSKRRIEKLKNSTPVTINVMQKFNGRERPDGDWYNKSKTGEPSTVWNVWGDATEVRIEGIRDAKLRELFRSCGLEVLEGTYTGGLIHYKLRSDEPLKSVLSYIEGKTNWADTAYNKHREEAFKQGDYSLSLDFEGSDIFRASRYCYAMANTDKMKKVISNPLIDPDLSILRNPYKVYLAYGIEAARNVIIREVWETIKGSGNDIAPRHITTIVDLMCVMGQIIATSSRGASKLGRETLADATFEKPVDFFVKAALNGAKETTNSTSSCVFLGAKCLLGTGATRTRNDPERPLEYFNKEGDKYWKPTVMSPFGNKDFFELGDVDLVYERPSDMQRRTTRASSDNFVNFDDFGDLDDLDDNRDDVMDEVLDDLDDLEFL